MSCFIVSQDSISGIINALEMNQLFRWNRDKILEAAGIGEYFDTSSMDTLANKLLDMNHMAFSARYHDMAEENNFMRRKITIDFSLIRLYKALECYLYQCAEGDVDSSPLYKTMEIFKNSVAHEIICKLPAYKAAACR